MRDEGPGERAIAEVGSCVRPHIDSFAKRSGADLDGAYALLTSLAIRLVGESPKN